MIRLSLSSEHPFVQVECDVFGGFVDGERARFRRLFLSFGSNNVEEIIFVDSHCATVAVPDALKDLFLFRIVRCAHAEISCSDYNNYCIIF